VVFVDKEEFDQWVDYVTEKYPIPRLLFKKGIDDWKSRVTLARALSRQKINRLEPAIELFNSIIDIDVEEPDDIENKAWALQDLGKCIWILEKDAIKALKYISMSIGLAESIQDRFSFVERGELWYDRWLLLEQLDQGDKALNEANQKLAELDLNLTRNSYLYYAFRFKADLLYRQGDIEQALKCLYQALNYFPDDYDNMDNLEELWTKRHDDIRKTYEKMKELTHYTYLCWDI
jgi:tetratricopeptide (TPR) repeat protein